MEECAARPWVHKWSMLGNETVFISDKNTFGNVIMLLKLE